MIGKKVTCSKCGEQFLVASAAAVAKLGSPAKPVARKPAPAKNPEDYDWEEVPDDDFDEDADDTEVVRKPKAAKGGAKNKKKGKKGKKGGQSSNGLLVAGGIVGSLAFLAMIGLGIYYFLLAGVGLPTLARFSFVPEDATMLIEYSPTKLEANPTVQSLKKSVPGNVDTRSELLKDCDRVVMTFGRNLNDGLSIAHYDKDKLLTTDSLSSPIARFAEATHDGVKFFEGPHSSAWMFSPRVWIVGNSKLVKRSIEMRKKPIAPEKFAKLSANADVVFYMNEVHLPSDDQFPPVVPGLIPTVQSIRKARDLLVTLNITTGMQFQFLMGFASSDDASAAMKGLDSLKNFGKASLPGMIPDPDALAEVTAFIDSIAMAVETNSLSLKLSVDQKMLDRAKASSSMFPVPFGPAPTTPSPIPGPTTPMPGTSPGIAPTKP